MDRVPCMVDEGVPQPLGVLDNILLEYRLGHWFIFHTNRNWIAPFLSLKSAMS